MINNKNKYDLRGISDVIKDKIPDTKSVKIIVAESKGKLDPFIIVFQEFCNFVAPKLSSAGLRVLIKLFGISGYECLIGIDQLTLAEEIKLSIRQIQNGLDELCKYNIIIKAKNVTDRRRNDYFINPMAAWRGRSLNRTEALKYLTKEQLAIEEPNQGKKNKITKTPVNLIYIQPNIPFKDEIKEEIPVVEARISFIPKKRPKKPEKLIVEQLSLYSPDTALSK